MSPISRMRASRRAQGLPDHIEDPSLLAQVIPLFVGPAASIQLSRVVVLKAPNGKTVIRRPRTAAEIRRV